MTIPSVLVQAPFILLTGAGVSLPLGCGTTKEFVEHFLGAPAKRLVASKNPLLVDVLNSLARLVSEERWDIERVLDLLERRATAVEFLSKQEDFLRLIKQRDGGQLRAYGAAMQTVADAIYSEVIHHYSAIDATQAARLYRPLLLEFPAQWFRGTPEIGEIKTIPFFTLNYDTAIESAASLIPELRLIDGFQSIPGATERRWRREAFETYEEDPNCVNVVLTKMHGSVRWGRRPGQLGTPSDEVIAELTVGVGRDPGDFQHAVLYPTLAPKPIDLEPFRTGYHCFRECLRGTRALLVIGTSLRDPEVAAAIRDGMDDHHDLHVIAVGPSVDHERVASALACDIGRVAALREPFTFPPEGHENPFLGGLRTLIVEACGFPLAGPKYFPGTYRCGRGPLARVEPAR